MRGTGRRTPGQPGMDRTVDRGATTSSEGPPWSRTQGTEGVHAADHVTVDGPLLNEVIPDTINTSVALDLIVWEQS